MIDLDVAILMYNLIEQSDNYLKTLGSLYQFYKDEIDNIITNSESFKFESRFLKNTKIY